MLETEERQAFSDGVSANKTIPLLIVDTLYPNKLNLIMKYSGPFNGH